jgi:hypothetical protein
MSNQSNNSQTILDKIFLLVEDMLDLEEEEYEVYIQKMGDKLLSAKQKGKIEALTDVLDLIKKIKRTTNET